MCMLRAICLFDNLGDHGVMEREPGILDLSYRQW